jgi:hypothetical protein
VTETIEAFGWEHDLDRRLQDDPLLRAMVTLDHHEIWNFIGEHFNLIELSGTIYQFEQAP